MQDASKILIVDDVPENISVLFEFLINQGFEVSIAPDGEAALVVVEHDPPDLILLDVMMPGIDGFETCRRLKMNPESKDIPVIFMTALSDTVDKVKGFQLGAVDYVTKPVQQDEVLGRVRAHVTIRNLQQRLERQNAELQAFAHTVAHDLKNPVGVILTASQLLKRDYMAKHNDYPDSTLALVESSAKRMQEIIKGLLTLAGLSHQRPIYEPLPMQSIVDDTLFHLNTMVREKQATVTTEGELATAYGHPGWVGEVWYNYISNALKYGGTPPKVVIGSERKGDRICFWVKDNGPGLSEGEIAQLFVPFTRLHTNRAEGHGLGLSIVQRIIGNLEGQTGVESTPGEGSRFWFSLPIEEPKGP